MKPDRRDKDYEFISVLARCYHHEKTTAKEIAEQLLKLSNEGFEFAGLDIDEGSLVLKRKK